MKKVLVSLAALLMCMCVLSACGGEKVLNDKPLSEAMTKINAEYFDGGESMREIDSLDKLELYYDIAPEDVAEFAAEVAKNSATEIDEVILIKAVDDDAAKRVAEKLELRLQSQKDLCASYSPELLAIAENCAVRTQGVLVTLVVTEDYEGVTALCDDILFS